MEAIMKKIDRSLFGTLLFLFGAMAIPLLCDYGYLPMTHETMLLITGSMLIGMYIWIMGLGHETGRSAQTGKS